MFDLRSRAGVLVVTTSAVVSLAVPVVAAGQVPGVDGVVGGVQETADSLVPAPAPALPAPPVSAPAPSLPSAPAPKAAPAPAAPTAPSSGSSSAPSAAPAPAASSGSSSTGADGPSRSRKRAVAAAASKTEKRGDAAGGRNAVAGASQDGGAGAPSDIPTVSQVADVSEEANADTLPFTGLQLALIGMVGLLAVAAGMTLRRGVRTRG